MTKGNPYLLKLFMLMMALACLGIMKLSAQVNLTTGLMAYYPFNGNANDISGNNNHGTPSGSAALSTDQWNNANSAYTFGGPTNGGKITIANSPSLQFSTAASFSFWAKLNSNVGTSGTGQTVAGGSQCFFAKEGDAGGGLYNLATLNGTNLNASVGNVSMPGISGALNPYTTADWVHYVYIMDATEQRLYINGVLANTIAGAPNFGTMNSRVLVLGRFNSNWYPLNGKLDEFRVYNRVLNAAEITALSSPVALTISITNISVSSICAGQPMSVDFSVTGGTPLGGNIYTLQLSDVAGNFTTPVDLDTLISSAMNGTFNFTMPDGVPSGSTYRFRVTASAPAGPGTASTGTITVNGVLGDIPNPAVFRFIGNSGGRNYFVNNAQQTWAQSQTSCQANGGHLACIPDAATNAVLAPHVSTGTHIGYTDQVTEGTWLWVNGQPTTYTYWYAGEPNNSGNEDFGHMLAGGQWNDINATVTRYAFLQLAPATSNSPVCQYGTLTLFAATLSGATYSWSGPNGFSSTQQNPVIPNAPLAANGTYTLTYTKGGCTGTATVSVTVTQSPNGNAQVSALLPSLGNGLILHYPFNGNANDASGNNLNGTVFGGVTASADRFDNANSAMTFNGSNGYIDVPDGIYFTGTDYTISSWVRTTSNASWSRLMDFGNGQANNNVLVALSNGTTGRPAAEHYINTVSGGQVASASTQVPLNQWSLLIYTWSGGTGRIYINGTQVASGSSATPQNILRTINYIGRSNWPGDAYANASFDDFRIYNRLLNAAEMQSLLLEQPEAMSLVALPDSVCPGTPSLIQITGSQRNVSYQLQNAATSANIGTAINGNCDTISISTGNLTATTNFQVVATGPGGCQQIIGPVTVTVIMLASPPTMTGATACGPDSVTLTASGAPVGATYYWYTAATGGTSFYAGSSYTTPVLTATTTYYVSIYFNGCESARSPVTATINLATAPAVDLYNGLIAHYLFNNNLGDSSGRGHHASPVWTITYANDRFGQANKAANLTSNNYVSCGNPWDFQALTNQVTLSIWIRENAGNWGFQSPLMNKWQGNGLYMGLDSYYDIGAGQQMNRVRWRVNSGTYVNSSVNVPHNQWHHIVCTYNGSRLKVYQNGVLTADVPASGAITNTIVNMEIGRQANGAGNTIYDGLIDDARVYNRVLNADEAMTLYNNGSVAFTNDPLCAGETLQLSSPTIAGATYTWSGPNGFSSNVQNPPAISNATAANAGTYSLVISNPNGCVTSPQTHLVVVNPLPAAPQTVNDTVCGSGNAVLTASGGSSYAWYNTASGGTVIDSDSSHTVNNLTATDTFYVSIVTSAGCEGPLTPVIAVYNNPVQTGLTVTGSSVCQGNNATVIIQNAQAGVNYQAFYNSTPVSVIMSGSGNLSLPINTGLLGSGANSITIVAQQPSCGNVNLTDTATVNIIVPAVPVITASGNTSICQGDSVMLTASAGAAYLWSNGAVTQSITVGQQGSYSVTVTYASGCSATSASTNVIVSAIPNASIAASGSTAFCQGGSVTLNASGGTNYLWSNGASGSSISVTQSGTYYVIASNGNCADTSASVNVTVYPLPSVPAISASGSTSICAGDSVTLTSTPALTYLWSNGATTQSITVNQSGSYSVTVGNSDGCTESSSAIGVTVSPGPNASVTANGSTTFCQGGSVTLNASGGTNYLWSNGANGSSVSVTQSGTYYVIASNGNCTDTSATVSVTVHALPTVGFTMPQDTFCANNGIVTLSGGSPAGGVYSGPGVSGGTFDPAQAGFGFVNIDYTYTDGNGCGNTATAIVWVDICNGIVPVLPDNNSISVFPNPAGSFAEISWSGDFSTLTILDHTGRIIDRADVSSRKKIALDVSRYAAGIYFAELNNADATNRVRFVKY